MGTDDAIVFTTGHQANVGTLGTILAPGDTVVADSGDHASILDGCLLSRAKLRPFRHNRHGQARADAREGGAATAAASSSSSTACSRWRATSPPLPAICDLCERFGARLMVDEAHAAGVLGARGAGTGELFGVEDRVDLRMGTFSKSLASCGGFIAGSHEVIEFLRIQSRAFLFTASGGAGRRRRRARGAADHPLRRGPRRCMARVLENARYLRDGLEERGFAVVAPQPLPDGRRRRDADRPGRSSATTGRPSSSGARSTTPACSSTPRCTPPSRPAARSCARASWRRTTAPRSTARSRRSHRSRSASRPSTASLPGPGAH